jgi:DNA-binding MarR family transcriptional regulator
MKPGGSSGGSGPTGPEGSELRPVGLGPALRQAWVGYHRRLDEAMAAAGFADHGFPDGRVLRICSRRSDVTIAQIGRELGITRQGAGKVVAKLSERGYVSVRDSTVSGREKVVRLTPRARDYLAARRQSARSIERQVRDEVGESAFDAALLMLASLGGDDQPRMRDYLRRVSDLGDLEDPEDESIGSVEEPPTPGAG